jgi:hypothetical protein
MGGWGIGLFFHGITAFDAVPFFNREWEERKLKQFLEEEEHKNNKRE